MTKDSDVKATLTEMAAPGIELLSSMRKIKDNPMDEVQKVLFEILNDNKDTEYGKLRRFSDVKTIDDYKKLVPFSVYDDYAEYVVREINGEKNLHSVYGVAQYNRSSGTMGNPKKIPMSSISMKQFTSHTFRYSVALGHERFGDDLFNGKMMCIMEASGMSEIAGKRYAGISSQCEMYRRENFDSAFTSPTEASIPSQQTDSRYLHARYGLSEKSVRAISTSFMTFLLDLFYYVEKNWQMLCDDIESGKINSGIRMSDEVRSKLESELKPMPERAAELRKIFSAGIDNTLARRIWPDIKMLIGIATGTFTSYLNKIRDRYTGDLPVVMSGVSASEGVFTVPYELDNPNMVPVTDIYIEFLPLGEDDPTKTKDLDEVEIGGEYEIIITTKSGLYRYRTRDAMRVTGFYGKLPTLEYMYRMDMCINLNGEKTYEPALRKTMEKTAKDMGFTFVDFTVNPNTDVTPSCYEFFIEMMECPDDIDSKKMCECLKKHLCEENPLLIYKFERKLCGPVMYHKLQSETYQLWRDKQILMGAASTQIKPVKIILNEAQLRYFRILIEGE